MSDGATMTDQSQPTITPTSDDPTEWSEETALDLINVVEAAHEGWIDDVPADHITEAIAHGLIDTDKNLTREGKVLYLGWGYARQVAEVEKEFLFMEIKELNAKLKAQVAGITA